MRALPFAVLLLVACSGQPSIDDLKHPVVHVDLYGPEGAAQQYDTHPGLPWTPLVGERAEIWVGDADLGSGANCGTLDSARASINALDLTLATAVSLCSGSSCQSACTGTAFTSDTLAPGSFLFDMDPGFIAVGSADHGLLDLRSEALCPYPQLELVAPSGPVLHAGDAVRVSVGPADALVQVGEVWFCNSHTCSGHLTVDASAVSFQDGAVSFRMPSYDSSQMGDRVLVLPQTQETYDRKVTRCPANTQCSVTCHIFNPELPVTLQ